MSKSASEMAVKSKGDWPEAIGEAVDRSTCACIAGGRQKNRGERRRGQAEEGEGLLGRLLLARSWGARMGGSERGRSCFWSLTNGGCRCLYLVASLRKEGDEEEERIGALTSPRGSQYGASFLASPTCNDPPP